MIVCYVDGMLKLLDSTRQTPAAISAAADWVSAFDRIDPTTFSLKLLKIGIRESTIPLLISHKTNHRMIVTYEGAQSKVKKSVFYDLNMLEFLILTDLLTQYDFISHVPSDVIKDAPFLRPNKCNIESYLDTVSK